MERTLFGLEDKNLRRLHQVELPFVKTLVWVVLLVVTIWISKIIEQRIGTDFSFAAFCSTLMVLFAFFAEGAIDALDMLIVNYDKLVRFSFFVTYPVMFLLMAGVVGFVILFLLTQSIWGIVGLILMAGLLKYVNCRTPIRLEKELKQFTASRIGLVAIEQ